MPFLPTEELVAPALFLRRPPPARCPLQVQTALVLAGLRSNPYMEDAAVLRAVTDVFTSAQPLSAEGQQRWAGKSGKSLPF